VLDGCTGHPRLGVTDPKMVRTVSLGKVASLSEKGILFDLGFHVEVNSSSHGGGALANRRRGWVQRVRVTYALYFVGLHPSFCM
jgi:hypothetical protein